MIPHKQVGNVKVSVLFFFAFGYVRILAGGWKRVVLWLHRFLGPALIRLVCYCVALVLKQAVAISLELHSLACRKIPASPPTFQRCTQIIIIGGSVVLQTLRFCVAHSGVYGGGDVCVYVCESSGRL